MEKIEIPFYPTRPEAVRELAQLVYLKPGAKFIDLGSGDARVLIELAKRYDDVTFYGIERNPALVSLSRKRANALNLRNVVIIQGDIFSINLSPYDTIYAYLTKEALLKLKPALESHILKGGEVFTFDFKVPGIEPYEVHRVKGLARWHRIYRYKRI